MDKIQFTRLNDSFFSFVFTVENINYSSGIIFTSSCSDEKFDALKSTIKENLLWLEENIQSLSVLVKSHLQENEVEIFNKTYLVSFSLMFEGNDYIPTLNLAYGDDGVYLLASIKNQTLISVKLND